MKRIALWISQLCALIILSIVTGGVWWRMWMDYGWVGSPGCLLRVTQADGEGAYNLMMDEMWLISFFVYLGLFILYGSVANKKKKK